jgi:hypothetical protein
MGNFGVAHRSGARAERNRRMAAINVTLRAKSRQAKEIPVSKLWLAAAAGSSLSELITSGEDAASHSLREYKPVVPVSRMV